MQALLFLPLQEGVSTPAKSSRHSSSTPPPVPAASISAGALATGRGSYPAENPASQILPASSSNLYPELNTQATFDFLDDLSSQDQLLSQGLSEGFLDRSGNESLYHTQPLDDGSSLGGLGR